jgi:hypothetical protein
MAPNDRLESIILSSLSEEELAAILGIYASQEKKHGMSDERSHESGESDCRPDCADCSCYPVS